MVHPIFNEPCHLTGSPRCTMCMDSDGLCCAMCSDSVNEWSDLPKWEDDLSLVTFAVDEQISPSCDVDCNTKRVDANGIDASIASTSNDQAKPIVIQFVPCHIVVHSYHPCSNFIGKICPTSLIERPLAQNKTSKARLSSKTKPLRASCATNKKRKPRRCRKCGLDKNRSKYSEYHRGLGYCKATQQWIRREDVCTTPQRDRDPNFPVKPSERLDRVERRYG